MFVGREREEEAIREFIAGAAQHGGALVVLGDPGIGKSTLADLARRRASEQGLIVLAATGVSVESRLPFAGLHQLLRPLRHDIETLARPRRDVILSAFGQSMGPVPDRFLVATAVAGLLATVAARQPVLVTADDAHWLDQPTGEVLAFLARRIGSEPIALLATVRDGYAVPLLDARLPELRLTGLGEDAAEKLLNAVAPALSIAARREILDISLGNPLALVELSKSGDGSGYRTATASATIGTGSVTYRIEKAFAARWSELPEETQVVLLAAALNEGGALGEMLDAATQIMGSPLTTAAVEPALSAGLVEQGPSGLRFRHPLVRSAIESRAGHAQITNAHHALAAVLADQPDRRAWHRAAASLSPDEEVAAELDEAAARAVQRAAVSVAVSALERAAELSTDSAARNGRLLRAAQLAWELGRPELVDRFAQSINRTDLNLPDLARFALLQENIEAGLSAGAAHISHLTGLARRTAAAGHLGLALDLVDSAARRCWWADPGQNVRLLVAETAVELADSPLHPTLQSALAFAAPDCYAGMVRTNLGILSGDASLTAVQLTQLGVAATILGAFEQARTLLAVAIPQLRRQGRLGLLVRALNHDATSAAYTAQWLDAISASEESERIAAEAGQHRWIAKSQIAKALATAALGRDAETEQIAASAEQMLLPVGNSSSMAMLQVARGFTALGRRDYRAAYEHLIRIFDPADSAHNHLLRMYHLGDLAEAASHSGHQRRAHELLRELTAAATEEPGPLSVVSFAYARAMLARDEDAGDAFERALASDLREWPFYHGRLRLEYGGWLRRHRQSTRSRRHLQAARDILDAIGASAWRDRADAELRASGARAQDQDDTPDGSRFGRLTTQERQIARLVLAGLSNREIGERLSVSHRTVGYYLYRMFPKLGITSRAELGAVLAGARVLPDVGASVTPKSSE